MWIISEHWKISIWGWNIPFSFLEVNDRCRNEESMAACRCTNACDVQMCPTGICLFNGPVGVACTRLRHNQPAAYEWGVYTCLGHFLSAPEMSLIRLRIGHEGHAGWKGNVLLHWSMPHMLGGEIPIHNKCPDELVSVDNQTISLMNTARSISHTVGILSSSHLGDWSLVVGRLDRRLPWIHLEWSLPVDVQLPVPSCS